MVWLEDKPEADDGAGEYSTLNCARLNTAPANAFWIDVEDGIRLRRCVPIRDVTMKHEISTELR